MEDVMVSSSTLKAVMSQWRPVPNPDGVQTGYIRSTSAMQDADRLTKHQNCVREKMKNQSGDASSVRSAFKQATQSCAEENDEDYADDLPDDYFDDNPNYLEG
jgi:uncharacterized membrane-anchored protein